MGRTAVVRDALTEAREGAREEGKKEVKVSVGRWKREGVGGCDGRKGELFYQKVAVWLLQESAAAPCGDARSEIAGLQKREAADADGWTAQPD
ncbi:hypothetical protein NDU88_005667 [Pleurodeles waltl]|uniref:Uncharacterized protein n=1 Tax=Pleurodeles waltl TaxID=8319 RepID=A0AAV7TB43_PLEWA|nr:hypothetical protein NDU88_005667 [Pleurodeles waltl]